MPTTSAKRRTLNKKLEVEAINCQSPHKAKQTPRKVNDHGCDPVPSSLLCVLISKFLCIAGRPCTANRAVAH
eukprot:858944-Amphidinium_carterae.1